MDSASDERIPGPGSKPQSRLTGPQLSSPRDVLRDGGSGLAGVQAW
jgi:hypothetical protein